jgi:hypothetical protein
VNYIITTCKNRGSHLASALPSWRQLLPRWTPIVVAVDDPEAARLTREVYRDLPHVVVEMSLPGWRKLPILAAGVRALPPDAELVVLFDCDIIAALPTAGWLEQPLAGFRVPEFGPHHAYPHDYGVLEADAQVLRGAFDLLEPIMADWEGYGSEDVLIRCACWIACGGRVDKPLMAWAHIPHGHDLRTASYPEGTDIQALIRANYVRFDRDYPQICALAGLTAAESQRCFHDCLGDWSGRFGVKAPAA